MVEKMSSRYLIYDLHTFDIVVKTSAWEPRNSSEFFFTFGIFMLSAAHKVAGSGIMFLVCPSACVCVRTCVRVGVKFFSF